jgi:drug/metabolite transporter (DMT)-like permease
MRFRDAVLAALTSVISGFGFVVIKLGLLSFSAPQLTALRFLVAALPVLLVPRPRIGWPRLVLIGLTLFTGQFLLLFFAIARCCPWWSGRASCRRCRRCSSRGFTIRIRACRRRSPARHGSASAAPFISAFATTVAYAIWGDLLQRYSAARAAPFALLAPLTGILSSALVFGEVFSPVRYAGMALILGGLAIIVFSRSGAERAPVRHPAAKG